MPKARTRPTVVPMPQQPDRGFDEIGRTLGFLVGRRIAKHRKDADDKKRAEQVSRWYDEMEKAMKEGGSPRDVAPPEWMMTTPEGMRLYNETVKDFLGERAKEDQVDWFDENLKFIRRGPRSQRPAGAKTMEEWLKQSKIKKKRTERVAGGKRTKSDIVRDALAKQIENERFLKENPKKRPPHTLTATERSLVKKEMGRPDTANAMAILQYDPQFWRLPTEEKTKRITETRKLLEAGKPLEGVTPPGVNWADIEATAKANGMTVTETVEETWRRYNAGELGR